ncbi:protein POLR1D-like [Chelonus insularis]|uniref:protein POLR1D-like n=1 Tax=Chelonus insularis TaxID=460826 RepID=UPI00158EB604|nr:protein POLR1D-like [Chelonus insularis]
MDEETLNRLAAEALIEEAKLGARRAEIMGPSGWVKPKETVNKRFLSSTIRNAVIFNRHRQKRKERPSESHSHEDSKNYNKEKTRSRKSNK